MLLESIGHRNKKIGPLSGILAKQSNQKAIILFIFAISRVQGHRQIGDTTIVIDRSMRKKEIGGAPAPKKIKHARGNGLDHQTTKSECQWPSINWQWPLSATELR